MTGYVDRYYSLQSEVPLQIWHHERCDETAAGSINVNWGVHASLHQQVVDGLNILVLASLNIVLVSH